MSNEKIELTLDDAVGETVTSDAQRFNLSREEIVDRLLRWYARQSDIVRGSVLAALPSSLMVDVAKRILQQLADGKDATK